MCVFRLLPGKIEEGFNWSSKREGEAIPGLQGANNEAYPMVQRNADGLMFTSSFPFTEQVLTNLKLKDQLTWFASLL